jgi:hypothetical protein
LRFKAERVFICDKRHHVGVVEICLISALGCIAVAVAWRFSARVQRQDLGVPSINDSIYNAFHAKMEASLRALAPVATGSALYAHIKDSLANAANVEDLNTTALALVRLEEEYAEQARRHQARNAKSEALSDLGSKLLPQKDA